jgi:hypothetical protein
MADSLEHGTERELHSSVTLRNLALSTGHVTSQKSAVLSYSQLNREITRSAELRVAYN